MLESLLVADRGLGAARVLRTCRRLGIKSVLAGLSSDVDAIPTDAAHLADDVVLLADAVELADPTAVVRAAQAAGVQAIHPGYGALRGDRRLADAAAHADVRAIVTAGIGERTEGWRALDAENVPTTPAGTPTTRWVYVYGVGGRIVVLGSARVAGDGLVVVGDDAETADDADDRGVAHRIAHAAAAVLGVDGLAAAALAPDGVVDVVPGLPESHAVWELVTGLDLVELQLGALSPVELDVTTGGAAVGHVHTSTVDDVRVLDDLSGRADADGGVIRIDAVALAGSAHGALVRASAWAEQTASARELLARFDHLLAPPA